MQVIFDIFEKAGHEIYLVGGIVRDKTTGAESNDFDFATSARPKETIRILTSNKLSAYPIGIEFGTIQTIVDGEKVEITTYRSEESYTKGDRKPAVVFGKTIEDDLERRDFTINAMAMDRHGKVIDPFGGKGDLKAGIIATPRGDPGVSFKDDPLRILRGCRFVARGFGKMDDTTRYTASSLRGLLRDLSSERVFEEMTKLLMSPHPSDGLRVMESIGAIEVLFPELQVVADFANDPGKYHHLSVWNHTLLVVDSGVKIPEVMWSCLFHDVAKPPCWSKKDGDVHFYQHDKVGSEIWELVADRLKTSSAFKKSVSQLIYEHQNLRGSMGDKGIRRLIHRLGDQLENQFHLARADIVAHKPSLTESSLADLDGLKRRVDNIENIAPVTDKLPTGTGIKIALGLGIVPGPELGEVMRKLQQKVVDGELNESSDFVKAAKELQ